MAKSSTKLGFDLGDPTGSTIAPRQGLSDSVEDPDGIAGHLTRLWDYEYQVRIPHEAQWGRSFDRFNLIFDTSRKAPWQSKRALPSYSLLARRAQWELVKPVYLSTGDLFKAASDSSPWKDLVDIPAEIVNRAIRSNGTNPSDFEQAWNRAMYYGVLTGNFYIGVFPEMDGETHLGNNLEEQAFGAADTMELPALDATDELPDLSGLPPLQEDGEREVTFEEMSEKPRIRFENLNPRDVLMDSFDPIRPKFVMWRQRLTKWQFRAIAKAQGWKNIEEAIQSGMSTTKDDNQGKARDRREKGEVNQIKDYEMVTLHHVIGTPQRSDGDYVFENKYCAWMGNVVVQAPTDLGLWHGKMPVVHGGMLERAMGAYHQSLCVLNLDPQEAQNEIMNSLLDYLHQQINPPVEIDHDQLHSAVGMKQLAKGLTPGGVIHLQKQNKAFPAVSRSATPDMPTGIWQGLQFYNLKLNETTTMADIGSQPRTRNRISADEAQERQLMSGGIWQHMILQLEKKAMAEIFLQTWLLSLQLITDEEWKALIQARIDRLDLPAQPEAPGGEETSASDSPINPQEPLLQKLKKMLTWDSRKRYRFMSTQFRFDPQVYSSVESKRRSLEKLKMLMEAASINPGMMQYTRWRKVTEQWVLALELDPNDFLWPDAGATQEKPTPPPAPEGSMPGTPSPVSMVPPPPPGLR